MKQNQVHDLHPQGKRGQALIEYALILALLALALAAILATTGPAVGNVFSNTVFNLVGQDPDDVIELTQAGGPNSFWQTVTWVARNPLEEQPFPTRPRVPTTEPTPGPSPTLRPTRPTDTPSPTPTFTVSPTAVDDGYGLPFIEDVDDDGVLTRWRLDNSLYLGGSSWFGEYFSNPGFSGSPDYAYWNWQVHRNPTGGANYVFHLDFDWGTSGFPISVSGFNWPTPRNQDFSIRYTRKIYLDAPETLRFNAFAADGVRVIVNGSTVIDDMGADTTLREEIVSADVALGAGETTVVVEYAEYDGGRAGVGLEITRAGGRDGQINPDDQTDEGNSASRCNWGRWNTRNASSLEWMFDEDPRSANGAGPNVTCYLELRGYLETGGAANPVMTFWDVWDFTGSSATARVEFAEYIEDPDPVPPVTGGDPVLDRPAVTWIPVDLHTGGTANYRWTRQEIDLNAVFGGSVPPQLTMRFVIENTGGSSGYRRWYLDDIVIDDVTDTPAVVTMGDFFPMDDGDKSAFVTSSRWDLTSDITYGDSGLSWDDSPEYSTDPFIQSPSGISPTTRVHYIELKDLVDLSPTSYDPATMTDIEGDRGDPILSFWHSFNVAPGTILEVEWSRDARNDISDGTGDTWTRLGTAALVDNTAGTANRADWRTMQFTELPLDEIPDWNVTPFRLRFAMYVTQNFSGSGSQAGWHIDNIYIERDNQGSFAPYPFEDGAESPVFTTQQWLFVGWNRTSGSARRSGNAYADSVSGDYQPNTNNSLQMKNSFDLLNDSPNLTGAPGDAGYVANYTATPVQPTLTFWHTRDLNSGATFHVDMYIPTTDTWVSIWNYTWGQSGNPFAADVQTAWERVEIDLNRAYQTATGATLASLTGNANPLDDDIRIAFRLQNLGTSTADGVFVDDIRIADYNENYWHLWDSSETNSGFTGDGESFTIDMEINDWADEFRIGGDWDRTTDDPQTGLRLVEDSPDDEDYSADSVSILELDRIIDLRGVESGDQPVMYFWSRYDIHSSDEIYVHISERDSGQTAQTYDRRVGWTRWENRWPGSRSGSTYTIDNRFARYQRENRGWHRSQVDLRQYAGDQIRIRFVVYSVSDDGGVGDGLFIDNIRFAYRRSQRIYTLPFVDLAQSTSNWVTEGDWGLALDFWKDTGGGPAQLGTNPWQVTFASCERLKSAPFSNQSPWNYGSAGCNNNANRYNTLMDWARGDLVNPNDGTLIPATGVNIIQQTVFDPLVLWYGTSRPGFTSDNRWRDNFGAYITRRVTIEEFSTYTFSTVADDGARVKINGPIGAPAGQQINPDDEWNITNLWGPFPGGPVQSSNAITLPPGEYDIVINWVEGGGSAFLSFTVANNNFSFTDTPNTLNALGGFDVVESIPFSDTSMMLNGVLDLRGSPAPILEYYTHWDFGSNSDSSIRSFGVFEYSTDGGFNWTSNRVGNDLIGPGGTIDLDGSEITGTNNFITNGWRLRRHNLTGGTGFYTMIRYRVIVRSDDTNWRGDGWYVTEIRINDGAGVIPGSGTPDNPEIDRLVLVNATTGEDIQELATTDVINLDTLPTRNLSIRAETFPLVVGSVRFEYRYNGGSLIGRTETGAPYAINGDNGGTPTIYNAWTPTAGTMTLTVTPYSGASATGNVGVAASYTFTVID